MEITLSSFWLILLICINVFTIFGGLVIKFNDMKHLKNKVKWICDELKDIRKEQTEQGKDIAELKGKAGL